MSEKDCKNKCAAEEVCSKNVKLYSARCMAYLKIMDSHGLNGLGEKESEQEDV